MKNSVKICVVQNVVTASILSYNGKGLFDLTMSMANRMLKDRGGRMLLEDELFEQGLANLADWLKTFENKNFKKERRAQFGFIGRLHQLGLSGHTCFVLLRWNKERPWTAVIGSSEVLPVKGRFRITDAQLKMARTDMKVCDIVTNAECNEEVITSVFAILS